MRNERKQIRLGGAVFESIYKQSSSLEKIPLITDLNSVDSTRSDDELDVRVKNEESIFSGSELTSE